MNNRTYKYQLRDHSQNKRLGNMLDDLVDVHNHFLRLQKRYYRLYKTHLNRWKLHLHLTNMLERTHSHWRWIPRDTLDAVIIRLDLAWQRFFDFKKGKLKDVSKVGPPKFKSKKRNNLRSAKFQTDYKLIFNDHEYITPDETTICSETGTVDIYFKQWCAIRQKLVPQRRNFLSHYHRVHKGNVKYIQILRDKTGKYWLYIITDYSEIQPLDSTGKSVGADYGMKDAYLTLNTGEKIQHPQPLRRNLNKIRKLNRELSYAVHDSNNYFGIKRALAKLHKHIANQRADFQWKLAHRLCKEFDTICIEDLHIKAMQMHRNWGRKTSDLAFSSFVSKLAWKCIKHGRTLLKCSRNTASTKTCFECGHKNESLTLKDRRWICPKCGMSHDRDINAAKNILRAAYDPA